MAWTAPRTWTDGELVTKAIMDVHVRDNLLAVGKHLIVRKSADQSVTSSTVLVDDTALQLTVGASDVWEFEFSLRHTAAAAGDLKVTFSFPASGRVTAQAVDLDATDALAMLDWYTSTSDTPTRIFGGIAATRSSFIKGHYVGGGTAGTLKLRWAQGTSSGTATTILANSALWAVQMA